MPRSAQASSNRSVPPRGSRSSRSPGAFRMQASAPRRRRRRPQHRADSGQQGQATRRRRNEQARQRQLRQRNQPDARRQERTGHPEGAQRLAEPSRPASFATAAAAKTAASARRAKASANIIAPAPRDWREHPASPPRRAPSASRAQTGSSTTRPPAGHRTTAARPRGSPRSRSYGSLRPSGRQGEGGARPAPDRRSPQRGGGSAPSSPGRLGRLRTACAAGFPAPV